MSGAGGGSYLGSALINCHASLIALCFYKNLYGKRTDHDLACLRVWSLGETQQGHPTTVLSQMLLNAVLGCLEYF